MSDNASSTTPPAETPKPVDTFKPTWKLPDGIEDDLTMGTYVHAFVAVLIVGVEHFSGRRGASRATATCVKALGIVLHGQNKSSRALFCIIPVALLRSESVP